MPAPIDWLRISPEIVLAAFAAAVLIADTLLAHDSRAGMGWLTFVGSFASAVAVVATWPHRGPAFQGMLTVDGFALAIQGVLLTGLALTALISISYLRRERLEHGEYYALLMLSTLGMMLLAASANLIMVFLSLEVLSIALYILAGFAREQPRSEEAGLKYLLLGSFASAFLLYGSALVYGAARTIDLAGVAGQLPRLANSPVLLAGVGMVLVGLGFKVAVVPFQMWTPDVYEGAPTTVTAFMSVGAKAAGFAVLMRVFVLSMGAIRPHWAVVLWVLAALSMGLGNVVAIAQDNIKRMLAYSSIAHAGYLMTAVVSANQAGLSSVPFYLLVYAFMNIGAFTVAFIVAREREQALLISDYSGLFFREPWLAVAMAVFMFGLAGLPPTGGFMAKFYVFAAAIDAHLIGLVIIGVLTTLISVYFYVRVTVMMFMKPPQEPVEALPIPRTAAAAVLVTAAVTLLLGVYPNPLFQLAHVIIR